MPTRAHLRGRQKLRENPVESTALFDFSVRSRTARQSEKNVRKSKTSTLLTALITVAMDQLALLFSRMGARRAPEAA
jgi:hypothetical protein